jgi:hypothetical protein
MNVVNLAEKLSQFEEQWSPRIVGEVNESYVKLVKLTGEFVWHHHDAEDEMFLVLKGRGPQGRCPPTCLRRRRQRSPATYFPSRFLRSCSATAL